MTNLGAGEPMIRTKEAKKKLRKSEQKHLKEVGINSMAKLENQVDFMRRTGSICYECRIIARKLGVDISGCHSRSEKELSV